MSAREHDPERRTFVYNKSGIVAHHAVLVTLAREETLKVLARILPGRARRSCRVDRSRRGGRRRSTLERHQRAPVAGLRRPRGLRALPGPLPIPALGRSGLVLLSSSSPLPLRLGACADRKPGGAAPRTRAAERPVEPRHRNRRGARDAPRLPPGIRRRAKELAAPPLPTQFPKKHGPKKKRTAKGPSLREREELRALGYAE